MPPALRSRSKKNEIIAPQQIPLKKAGRQRKPNDNLIQTKLVSVNDEEITDSQSNNLKESAKKKQSSVKRSPIVTRQRRAQSVTECSNDSPKKKGKKTYSKHKQPPIKQSNIYDYRTVRKKSSKETNTRHSDSSTHSENENVQYKTEKTESLDKQYVKLLSNSDFTNKFVPYNVIKQDIFPNKPVLNHNISLFKSTPLSSQLHQKTSSSGFSDDYDAKETTFQPITPQRTWTDDVLEKDEEILSQFKYTSEDSIALNNPNTPILNYSSSSKAQELYQEVLSPASKFYLIHDIHQLTHPIPAVDDESLKLPLSITLSLMSKQFAGLEEVIRQRHLRNLPLFFASSTANGTMSVQKHVEQITRRNFSLSLLCKIAWIAPHLISLRWSLNPQKSHKKLWDIEIEQRPLDSEGPPIFHALRETAIAQRAAAFRMACIRWIYFAHIDFIKRINPSFPHISLKHLSSWHPDFDLEKHVPGIPKVKLPDRPTPVRSLSLTQSVLRMARTPSRDTVIASKSDTKSEKRVTSTRSIESSNTSYDCLLNNENDVSTPSIIRRSGVRAYSSSVNDLEDTESITPRKNLSHLLVTPPRNLITLNNESEKNYCTDLTFIKTPYRESFKSNIKSATHFILPIENVEEKENKTPVYSVNASISSSKKPLTKPSDSTTPQRKFMNEYSNIRSSHFLAKEKPSAAASTGETIKHTLHDWFLNKSNTKSLDLTKSSDLKNNEMHSKKIVSNSQETTPVVYTQEPVKLRNSSFQTETIISANRRSASLKRSQFEKTYEVKQRSISSFIPAKPLTLKSAETYKTPIRHKMHPTELNTPIRSIFQNHERNPVSIKSILNKPKYLSHSNPSLLEQNYLKSLLRTTKQESTHTGENRVVYRNSVVTPYKRFSTPRSSHSPIQIRTPVRESVRHREILEKARRREQTKTVENMLKSDLYSIEARIETIEDAKTCFNAIVNIFSKSHQHQIITLDRLANQLPMVVGNARPGLDPLRAKKAIEYLVENTDNFLSYEKSKLQSQGGGKVLKYHGTNNMLREKAKINKLLEEFKSQAEKDMVYRISSFETSIE